MPFKDQESSSQFEAATIGIPVSLMRDQILANVQTMFLNGPYDIHRPQYSTILSEHEDPARGLLSYQTAVICIDDYGTRLVLKGSREPTIWAAYRNLMRITMREVGKRMMGGHIRTGSASSEESVGSCSDPKERISKSSRVLGIEGFQTAGLR